MKYITGKSKYSRLFFGGFIVLVILILLYFSLRLNDFSILFSTCPVLGLLILTRVTLFDINIYDNHIMVENALIFKKVKYKKTDYIKLGKNLYNDSLYRISFSDNKTFYFTLNSINNVIYLPFGFTTEMNYQMGKIEKFIKEIPD